MDDDDSDIVQQNRNYILATCTALGGYEEKEVTPGVIEQVYSLGDEALGCLRDIKRAIRAESNAPYKTFLPALADFNTLENDFIPIIKMHAHDPSEMAERLILACLELIVPMTWPLQQRQAAKTQGDDSDDDDEYDPNLLLRYRRYKLALMQPGILEAFTRLLVEPLSIPYRERSMRDQIVIRLVLYFFRNLAAIPDLNVSQSAPEESLMMASMQEKLLLRFCETGITDLVLVMASNSNEPDAAEWNVIVLEILFYLLQGAPAKEVFASDLPKGEDESASMLSDRVSALLRAESDAKRSKTRNAPTRHQRFGGTYAIKSWDGDTRVSHKQGAAFVSLGDIIDSDKKPDRRGLKRKERDEGGWKVYTTSASMARIKDMAQSFIKNAFNTFYLSLIKDIEREDKKIVERDYQRLFYTMQWFLEYLGYEQAFAARGREKNALEKDKEGQNMLNPDELYLPTKEDTTFMVEEQPLSETDNAGDSRLQFDYDQVATAMDLRAFMLCLRRLQMMMDEKNWKEVQVTADCFRQLLVTASTMSGSPNEEFRDVAEYILSNIYHEHSTLDLFVNMIRKYKSQSFGYLKSAVELTHVMLKLLEQYSSKNQFMFVRRKVKQKNKKQDTGNDVTDEGHEDFSEDEAREEQVAYREHVFKFDTFEKKYLHYDVVNVYCMLLEHLETLDPHIVHCITSLFYRIMVKCKAEQLFFKLPVLDLFNKILGRLKTLPRNTATTELVRFIRYCTRQFFKRLEEYPPLFIEVLFANPRSRRSR